MVAEFPEHTKAAQAQFQIGNIYFYTIHDYKGGWPAYVAVAEKFPDSYEASQAGTLLKQTAEVLTEISFLKDEIDKFRKRKRLNTKRPVGRITLLTMWVIGYSDFRSFKFQQIAVTGKNSVTTHLPLMRIKLWHEIYLIRNSLLLMHCSGSAPFTNKMVSTNARFNLTRICLKTRQNPYGGMKPFINRQSAIDPSGNLEPL